MSGESRKRKRGEGETEAEKEEEEVWQDGIKYKMFVVPEGSVVGGGKEKYDVVTLPHPGTESLVKYLVRNNVLMEIQRMGAAKDLCAWFYDDYVVGDGHLYLATPIDPLLVAIPALRRVRARGRDSSAEKGVFTVRDQMFHEDFGQPWDRPTMQLLGSLVSDDMLSAVCDTKQFGDTRVFRLNDDRVDQWLMGKLYVIARGIVEEGLVPDAPPAAAVAATKEGVQYVAAALEVLGEYVDDETRGRLAAKFPALPKKEGAVDVDLESFAHANNPQAYLIGRTGSVGDVASSSAKAKAAAKVQTPVQKRLLKAKEAQGLKNISSFFTPVAKKRKRE
eukprot:CAMPEP_0119137304 /NCGR_PEP_ID=MMETSP1310-20130426/23343_1 /TAXON_ID=464262 /ORGANISM="Genus nov. species nov., Strain RCC2339" /LENGTH=333 /DNA_ID=CAMNT_0007128383 /DNA_START=116 /DNA_END=1117 /DNA_ORIENTATION=-